MQQGGGYIKVCCPAHDDRNPSCSIRYDAHKGKTTVRCHAGCADEDVLAAAGLTFADLYDEPLERSGAQAPPSTRARAGRAKKAKPKTAPKKAAAKKAAEDEPKLRFVHAYRYHEAGRVVRYDLIDRATGEPWIDPKTGVPGKTFRPEYFDAAAKRWKTGKFEQYESLLYRAVEVPEAIAADQLVYVVEGEKDADTAAEHDLVAGTNAGGAGNFTPGHAEHLRGARVVLVVDRDLAGYERGIYVPELLDGIAESCRVVAAAGGNDLTDHFEAGRAAEELEDIDPLPLAVQAAIDDALRLRDRGEPESRVTTLLNKARRWLEQLPEGDLAAHLTAELRLATAAEQPPDELEEHRRRRHAQEPHHDPDDDAEPNEPQHPIPTGSGHWAYSIGDDGLERGVYRHTNGGWLQVGPLPHVLERLERFDGSDNRQGISYRLAMRPLDLAEDVIICADEEVRDGTWAERLDVALAADDKIIKAVATAVRTMARDAPLRKITPGWSEDGELSLPPIDVLGGGYGETRVDEDTALQVWQRIAEVTPTSPKVALALGAAIGGLFVRPLLGKSQRSFWLQMVGRSQHGKTTTLKIAASTYGNPDLVVETFNATGKGLNYWLGDLACLPVFLDESGSGVPAKPADREQLILAISEGVRRRVATRTGTTKNSAPWHGSIVCTGNDSLLDGIANEAVFARLIEVPAPITDSVDDCAVLDEQLAQEAYGWPLRWIRDSLDLDRVRDFLTEAKNDLGVPEGGVPKTMAHNLALVIAGAAELDHHLGTSTLRPAALKAAMETLARLIDELRERGMTPGERLMKALVQRTISRAASWPALSELRALLTPDDGRAFTPAMPRDVEGFLLDDGPAGDIAVLTSALPDIAADEGITDPSPGLRELDHDGVLLRSNEDGGKRIRRIRIRGNLRAYAYVFRLPDDERTQLQQQRLDDAPDDGAGEDHNPFTDAATRPNPPEHGSTEHEGVSPVSPAVPDPPEPVDSALTRPNPPPVPGVPGVPGENAMSRASARTHVREGGDESEAPPGIFLAEGPNGPIYRDARDQFGRCRACGDTSRHYDRDGWIHWNCALKSTAAPAPSEDDRGQDAPSPEADATESAAAVAEDHVPLTGPVPPRPTGYRASCVTFDPTGLYLPDGVRYRGVPITDAFDILDAAERLRIGHPGGPGQLILLDPICVELALVAEAEHGLTGDEARQQIFDQLAEYDQHFLGRARENGWEIDTLRVETRARRGDRVFDIVLAPYEHLWNRGGSDRHPLGPLRADESLSDEQLAAESARVMGRLAQLIGAPWRSSPVQAGWDLYHRAQKKRKRRGQHLLTVPGALPKLTGSPDSKDLMPDMSWARWTSRRPADETERAELENVRYAVNLDRKMAWPAAGKDTTLGYLTDDEPTMTHHEGADAVAELIDRPEAIPAGMFRVRVPAAERNDLPPLHAGQAANRARWLWVPPSIVASLRYADDPASNILGWGCSLDELLTPDPDDEKHAEAWTFPRQGRLLDGLWYSTYRDARYLLDRDEADQVDDEIVGEMVKRSYGGMLQTTLHTPKWVRGNAKIAWQHQATWHPSIRAHHYMWQWHLLRRANYQGLLIAAVHTDEVVVLVKDIGDAVLGKMSEVRIDRDDDGHLTWHQDPTSILLGQYKVKGVRELSDEHRDQLAHGTPPHKLTGGEVPRS